ncbi:mycothiol synthase [Amycolatopsis endophytica]|uniref:Mycothiol acetyltransferase n=1 Tax=Amycolatopsis endophytica TaxID=860233 RepID=A0A853B145_9PSEU|nr:mycothiol synthase [Amycolatopsis endophytica]NYI88602.1 mycothiol synthase [Amycolatopsis endophytica]
MLTVVWVDELDEATTREVRELLAAARDEDGRPDLPPGGALPGEFATGLHLLGRADGVLAGYGHLDVAGDAFGRQVAELVVRPDHRRRGVGSEMLSALVDRAGEATVRLWAHGDHPGAAAIAERAGFSRARELLIMRTAVDPDWPEPTLPEGVSLRTFVPGQDEQAVIEVNARAFDWHPEQGRLTVADLRAEEAADWFDADGFFLAEDTAGKLLGFHWTKVHPANPHRFGGRETGEVYVVGVDPGAQGGGLGKALTLAGLRHLRDRGLPQVILYVEGDNAPAIAVYSRLGFTRHEVDVQYER